MSKFGDGELPLDFGPRIYTVSEIVKGADDLLRSHFFLVVVEGEVASPKLQRDRGTFYFDLKDEFSTLPCVMFRNRLRLLGGYIPEEGELVQARGTLSVYHKTGSFKLIVEHLEPAGEGVLRAAFERLKRKLQAEGLFDQAHKKPIPQMPSVIGIVTSLEGAALHDLVKVIRGRFPPVRIIVAPSRVQGERAPEQLIEALKRLEQINEVDVIIIARGGGSEEDLAAFNDENLARAIFACKKPVISAVGHEVDITIADLVADVRAATPSHAGELVVPHIEDVENRFKSIAQRIYNRLWQQTTTYHHQTKALGNQIKHSFNRSFENAYFTLDHEYTIIRELWRNSLESRKQRLNKSYTALLKYNPQQVLERQFKQINDVKNRLIYAIDSAFKKRVLAFERTYAKLQALNPRSVLERGYSVAIGPNGKAVKNASTLNEGDLLKVIFFRGSATTKVESINEKD